MRHGGHERYCQAYLSFGHFLAVWIFIKESVYVAMRPFAGLFFNVKKLILYFGS